MSDTTKPKNLLGERHFRKPNPEFRGPLERRSMLLQIGGRDALNAIMAEYPSAGNVAFVMDTPISESAVQKLAGQALQQEIHTVPSVSVQESAYNQDDKAAREQAARNYVDESRAHSIENYVPQHPRVEQPALEQTAEDQQLAPVIPINPIYASYAQQPVPTEADPFAGLGYQQINQDSLYEEPQGAFDVAA